VNNISLVLSGIADLNNDGKLDFVGELDLGSLCPFLGNGDGTFASSAATALGVTGGVAMADFNGDGKQDIIYENGGVRMFPQGTLIELGNGDGTFQAPVHLMCFGGHTIVGDFNGDGKLDVASGNSICLGNGDGTFQAAITFPSSVDFTGAGDFNGDGRLDLLNGSVVELQSTGPLAALSAQSLSFAAQAPGIVSKPQVVTLTNPGSGTLDITSISISGGNPNYFAETNTCGSTLAINAQCQISVTFTPPAAGSPTASLSITDNAPGSPHSVSLQGIVEDFSLAVSSATTITVTRGQAANYSLTATPINSFNQNIAFTCGGAPSGSTCTVTPSSLTLDGSSSATASAAVITASMMALTHPGSGAPAKSPPSVWIAMTGMFGVAGFVFAGGSRHGARLRLIRRCALLCTLCLGFTMWGCGGGNNSSATPTGSYQLTVTGTYAAGSATLAHSVNFTLIVQ